MPGGLGDQRAVTGGQPRHRRSRHPCLLRQQEHQQRLLRVQPVLRLVPDRRLRTVDDLVGDLPAAVRRQAVQHDRARPPARASRSALTWYGRNGPTRSSPSFSCPIDVQVSVTSTSAPSTAACGSVISSIDAAGLGGPLLGVQQDVARAGRTRPATRSAPCIPAFAPPTISECAMLLAPSPR